jgi:beta-N-acetylhexosaminidase
MIMDYVPASEIVCQVDVPAFASDQYVASDDFFPDHFTFSPHTLEMTLEEKVGQLLMVHFHGEKANEEARVLVQEVHIGAVIYYNWANGLTSPEQVRGLSVGLQKMTRANRLPIPLLIAVDQEGGRIARLKAGFTHFPGNQVLGLMEDPSVVEKCAFVVGQELKAVGVNMNLAPVVDVDSNPLNPVIGDRSFSCFPDKVSLFASSAIKGFRRAGVITSLKHFPGHGDVEVDSHLDLPVIGKSREELERIELFPFARLASQADTIMTAHLLVPALDSEYCATLSKKTLQFLRGNLFFKGVIISDSLVMEGILKEYSLEEAAVLAINAGCDMLILGGKQLVGGIIERELKLGDVLRLRDFLVEAVRTGIITERRLNGAVKRVLELKDRYKLLDDYSVSQPDWRKVVNAPESQAFAEKISLLSLEILNGAKPAIKIE